MTQSGRKKKELVRRQKTNPALRDEMLKVCSKNKIKLKYVLNDVWYASSDNMKFVKEELGKEFIMPVKTNRKVALSKKEKLNGKYFTVRELELKENTTYKIYLEGVKFPLLLIKQVFRNEDGSEGILYLVSSDLTLTYGQITVIYQKR